MPTLHWIGKEKVINHHLDVPFKVLEHAYSFTDAQHTDNRYYLGLQDSTAYYFYYAPDDTTALSHQFLATIRTKAEQYVIYADNCLQTKEYLAQHRIVFKKIPRDITRF